MFGIYFCNLYVVEINPDIISWANLRYLISMRYRIISLLLCVCAAVSAVAQKRVVQNKPYIDLRMLHFGIQLGFNMQDAEFTNVGPQSFELPEGGMMDSNVLCDVDNWNPGFSVGVLADLRLNRHFSLRFTPTMHFGQKHLVFRNLMEFNEGGKPLEVTQDLKNTYISVPIDLKFSAERFNNYRPYVMAGVVPMLNLAGKDQDYVQLKRQELMFEVGMGCDFYLPFFKLIPELKFCYGLGNALDKGHIDELRDVTKLPYARSISSVRTKMIVLTFYFE